SRNTHILNSRNVVIGRQVRIHANLVVLQVRCLHLGVDLSLDHLLFREDRFRVEFEVQDKEHEYQTNMDDKTNDPRRQQSSPAIGIAVLAGNIADHGRRLSPRRLRVGFGLGLFNGCHDFISRIPSARVSSACGLAQAMPSERQAASEPLFQVATPSKPQGVPPTGLFSSSATPGSTKPDAWTLLTRVCTSRSLRRYHIVMAKARKKTQPRSIKNVTAMKLEKKPPSSASDFAGFWFTIIV